MRYLGALAMPLVCSFLLTLVAALAWLRGSKRASAALVVLAMAAGYLGSLPLVGYALLRPLEDQYPPLDERSVAGIPRHVVVLGSSYDPRDRVSVTAALDADGLARLVEGVRLLAHARGGRLILSGGARGTSPAPALGYARLAQSLGVASDSLVILDRPMNTAAEAREVAATLRGAPFVLVTSAHHMPRAMRLMRREGQQPIPAPATRHSRAFTWTHLLPGSGGLRSTELACHEYLGLLAIAAGVD